MSGEERDATQEDGESGEANDRFHAGSCSEYQRHGDRQDRGVGAKVDCQRQHAEREPAEAALAQCHQEDDDAERTEPGVKIAARQHQQCRVRQ